MRDGCDEPWAGPRRDRMGPAGHRLGNSLAADRAFDFATAVLRNQLDLVDRVASLTMEAGRLGARRCAVLRF